MNPVRLASPVSISDAVTSVGWGGEPPVIYDGFELMPGDEPVIHPPCIACGSPLAVDLAAVLAGRFPADDWALQLAPAFRLEVKRWNEIAVVVDARGLTAYTGLTDCDGCGRSHLVCIGYGEWQPARYLATYCGAALVET
jgi:hypothetical protein